MSEKKPMTAKEIASKIMERDKFLYDNDLEWGPGELKSLIETSLRSFADQETSRLREALERIKELDPLEVNSHGWEYGDMEQAASDIGSAYTKIATDALQPRGSK